MSQEQIDAMVARFEGIKESVEGAAQGATVFLQAMTGQPWAGPGPEVWQRQEEARTAKLAREQEKVNQARRKEDAEKLKLRREALQANLDRMLADRKEIARLQLMYERHALALRNQPPVKELPKTEKAIAAGAAAREAHKAELQFCADCVAIVEKQGMDLDAAIVNMRNEIDFVAFSLRG